MKLTYFGHSCFLLETDNAKILFDPFITPNELAKDIKVDSIECDFVFLSHGHEDHVADAESILKRTGAKLVGSYEVTQWFLAKGISNYHPMNLGGSWNFDFGRVKYVGAIHSSSLPDGSYGGNPGGFVIQADGKTIYYSGDTALTYDMKLIAEEFIVDWAMLPIGDNFTMGPHDASKAAEFVNCRHIIGMHFDTFGYIKLNHADTVRLFEEKGQTITLMNIGESKEL